MKWLLHLLAGLAGGVAAGIAVWLAVLFLAPATSTELAMLWMLIGLVAGFTVTLVVLRRVRKPRVI